MDREALEARKAKLLEDMRALQERIASDRAQFTRMQGAVAMIDEWLKADEPPKED